MQVSASHQAQQGGCIVPGLSGLALKAHCPINPSVPASWGILVTLDSPHCPVRTRLARVMIRIWGLMDTVRQNQISFLVHILLSEVV